MATVETIGQRITRLRNSKGWSLAKLGKEMGEAIDRPKPYTGEQVRRYEIDKDKPPPDARRALAKVFAKSEEYIEFGDRAQGKRVDEDLDRAQDAREAILLHLYRGLFSLQQARLIQNLRALFEANQVTRKELGQKPLRGVSDEQVVRAFGKVPAPKRQSKPKRDIGDAMGDFLDD